MTKGKTLTSSVISEATSPLAVFLPDGLCSLFPTVSHTLLKPEGSFQIPADTIPTLFSGGNEVKDTIVISELSVMHVCALKGS